MISQPHTPTTGQVETGFALYLYDYENIVVSAGRDRFKAWLAARDARIEAAAEQRGAIKALRDVEASLIDWEVIYGHEEGTPEQHESIRIAAWVGRRADQMEGDE